MIDSQQNIDKHLKNKYNISFKYGDEEGEYRARDIASVVELLPPDVFNRSLLDKYLSTAQRIYEEYLSQK